MGGHNYLMDRDVAAIGSGVWRVNGANVVDAGRQELPGIVSLFPPGIGCHGVGDGGTDLIEVVVDPFLAVGE